MTKPREKSRYAAKRDAGRVPHRYSDRYAQWFADARSGRDSLESYAAWTERFAPDREPERLAA